MEKGIIKLHKSGKVKKFTKSNGKGANVPSLFDFSNFIPQEGTKQYNCQYELDEKGNIAKIEINGKTVPLNQEKLKEKEEKQKRDERKKKAEEQHQKELQSNKEIINYFKDDFVKADKAFLPNDSKNILVENEWKVDNFSLRLNKLARFEENERDPGKSKFLFFNTNRGKIIYKPKYKFDERFISQINTTNLNAAKNIFGNNFFYTKLSLSWRIIVGLGNESVYETAITLHHIYGIPYIPASSIKGVVRSYIIQEYFGKESDKPAEYLALQDETFCKIFGTAKETKIKDRNNTEYTAISPLLKDGNPTEHIGMVTFFDAFPTQEPKIEPDIMNVHYPDYYDNKDWPTDTQSPRPIFFLTVTDTPFQFIIGSKNEKLENLKIGGKAVDEWLTDALSNHGIGAKTAVGYGRMT